MYRKIWYIPCRLINIFEFTLCSFQKVKFLGLILYTIGYAVIPKVRGIPKINFRIE